MMRLAMAALVLGACASPNSSPFVDAGAPERDTPDATTAVVPPPADAATTPVDAAPAAAPPIDATPPDGPPSPDAPPCADCNLIASAIGAGGYHTCAVVAGGMVRCWGDNTFGGLGDGTMRDSATPVTVAGLTGATQLALGDFHSCAIVAGGTVRCWGMNAQDQLGTGSSSPMAGTVEVPGLSGVTQIASGDGATCAIHQGQLSCWGIADLFQGSRASMPVQLIDSSNPLAVAVGPTHACVVLPGGQLRCWGTSAFGEAGSTRTSSGPMFADITLDGAVTEVVTAGFFTCAIHGASLVSCWGADQEGMLGNGLTRASATPTVLPGVIARHLAASGSHVCAAEDAGQVWCWGSNQDLRLGPYAVALSRSTVRISAGSLEATALVAGASHTCALTRNGLVRCWGDNSHGQLGHGPGPSSATPTSVLR